MNSENCKAVEHCIECDATSPTKCSQCALNLQVNAAKSVCFCETEAEGVCTEGKVCNKDHKCIEIGACSAIQGCIECQLMNQNLCNKCVNNKNAEYIVSNDGTKCLPFTCESITKCASCVETQSNRCAACQSGHHPTVDGKACECVQGSGKTCGSGTVCSPSQNQCVKTSICITAIPNCTACDYGDQALCYSCGLGYFVSSDKKSCISLDTCKQVANCGACDEKDPSKCVACADNLHLNLDKTLCECESHSGEACPEEYKCSVLTRQCIYEDECKYGDQEIPYCTSCDWDDPRLCYQCEVGFKYVHGLQCIKEKACLDEGDGVLGCKTCMTQDPRKCVECTNLMSPIGMLDACGCGPQAQFCEGTSKCLFLDGARQCVAPGKCSTTVKNCASCAETDATKCIACAVDYQLTAANTCEKMACNIEHCEHCATAETCQICGDNLRLSTDGTKCVCGNMDTACLVGTHCFRPADDNEFSCQSYDLCLTLDTNCEKCSLIDSGNCVLCTQGFQPIDGVCKVMKCQETNKHCVACNAQDTTKCAQCSKGLSPSPDGLKCQCGNKECADEQICMDNSQCVGLQDCLGNDKLCSACSPKDPRTCMACTWGASLNEKGKCEEGANCSSIKNCIACDKNDTSKCYKCLDKLHVANDGYSCECVDGSGKGCDNGLQCTNSNVCVEDYMCLKSVEHCVACVYENVQQCYACLDGFYLSLDKLTCLPTSTCAAVENCKGCVFDAPEKCYNCKNGLTLSSDGKKCECVKNSGVACAGNLVCESSKCVDPNLCLSTDPHCKECKYATPSTCYACKENFYPNKAGVCVSNESCSYIENCIECNYTETHRCYKCDDSLALGIVGLTCECVPGSRQGCPQGETCATFDGICVPTNKCQKEIMNCTKCLSTDHRLCSGCVDGFVAALNGLECVPADLCKNVSHCDKCNAILPNRCVSCADGLAPNAGGVKCLCGGEEYGVECAASQKCENGKCVAKKSSNPLSAGAIAGICIAAVVVVVAVAAAVFYCAKHKKQQTVKSNAVSDKTEGDNVPNSYI